MCPQFGHFCKQQVLSPPNFFSKLGPWYHGMVFRSDGRWNKDIDARIGNANAVMRELYRSVSQNGSFSGICFDLYLWSWILGKDWKSTIWSASGKEGIFAKSSRCDTNGVAKGGGVAVRPWRHFYGGGTMGYAVGYTLLKAVLKQKWF